MWQQKSRLEMHSAGPAATDKRCRGEGKREPSPWHPLPLCFHGAHQQHCCYVVGPLLFGIWESICAVTGGASLNGCPGHWAIHGTEWAAASCSGETATLLFSPWPVLQNIVCTSVILPTPWAQGGPPPILSFSLSAITTMFSLPLICSQPSCPYSFSPSHSLSSRHSPFLLHKDIVKQIHPHTFSHWHPYTNTPRALKIHPCVKITVVMCRSHYSLLGFAIN